MSCSRKRVLTAAVIGAALLVCLAALDARLKTVLYTVTSPKLSGTVRLALLTDLHANSYGEGQETLLAELERQRPDFVLLVGDICDEKRPFDPVEQLLQGIAGKYPCFYVTGNHEYFLPEIEPVLALFRSYGVMVLEGETVTLGIRGLTFNLCGIDDPFREVSTDTLHENERQLDAVSAVMENGYYTVLLAHRPERLASYAKRGFDLVLSSHTHGGQWRVPGICNGLYAPHQGLFPEYAGGEYSQDGTHMIVSRGLERESGVPRIWNRPELVIVDLKPE